VRAFVCLHSPSIAGGGIFIGYCVASFLHFLRGSTAARRSRDKLRQLPFSFLAHPCFPPPLLSSFLSLPLHLHAAFPPDALPRILLEASLSSFAWPPARPFPAADRSVYCLFARFFGPHFKALKLAIVFRPQHTRAYG
jgi:hypothetical protein